MTQVKDMSGSATGTLKNFRNPAPDLARRSKERNRIQVPLYPDIVSDTLPPLVEAYPPIQTDDIAACSPYKFKESGSPGAEVDHGSPRSQ